MDRFVDGYGNVGRERCYLLVMLSFARWRAEKRVGEFEKMVQKEWRRRESDHRYSPTQKE
jgi:hypothetical protein